MVKITNTEMQLSKKEMLKVMKFESKESLVKLRGKVKEIKTLLGIKPSKGFYEITPENLTALMMFLEDHPQLVSIYQKDKIEKPKLDYIS